MITMGKNEQLKSGKAMQEQALNVLGNTEHRGPTERSNGN